MATVKSEAYDHGKAAFECGKFLKDNPYGRNGFAYVQWRMGWRDARQVARFFGNVKIIDPQRL